MDLNLLLNLPLNLPLSILDLSLDAPLGSALDILDPPWIFWIHSRLFPWIRPLTHSLFNSRSAETIVSNHLVIRIDPTSIDLIGVSASRDRCSAPNLLITGNASPEDVQAQRRDCAEPRGNSEVQTKDWGSENSLCVLCLLSWDNSRPCVDLPVFSRQEHKSFTL